MNIRQGHTFRGCASSANADDFVVYFRHGVSTRTFSYHRAFVWRRVVCWLRHKHLRANWRQLRRHSLPGWWPTEGEVTLFNPSAVTVSRYRYRAARIASPWAERPSGSTARATA